MASALYRQKFFWRRPQLSAILHEAVELVSASSSSPPGAQAFAKWQAAIAALYGDIFERPRLRNHCAAYTSHLNVKAEPAVLVFALHTIYGFLARALVVQHLFSQLRRPLPDGHELIRQLTEPEFYRREFGVINFLPELWEAESLALFSAPPFAKLAGFANDASAALAAPDWQNVLTALYQTILPSPIRHDLGEFFTPAWLAEKTIALAGCNGEMGQTVFDPGCGSGVFLLTAAARKIEKHTPLADLLNTVSGCDLNPLSVLSARLNLLVLLSKHFQLPLPEVELPIFHYDSVFQTPLGNTAPAALQKYLAHGCDYLVGNPPWISWNCLPPVYRRRLENELLPQYVLFDFHGQAARLGHGNDDYLSTFTLVTIDRYLKEHGLCSFIIKQPLLTNVAGKTFRRFEIRRTAGEITPLRVRQVADLRALNPFGIGNETAILVLEKGAATNFPVDYAIWSQANGHLEIKTERAQPGEATDVSSAWIVMSSAWRATQFMEGENPYEIRHGLKHDAAEVLIIRVLEKSQNRLRIQRLADTSIHEIEPDWVYPFLQPRHLQKWGRDGYFYVLMPQRKAGEDNEPELSAQFPLTHAFLKRFAPEFAARRSKVFVNKPFYGLFGLGEYTHAPYKVCWVGLGFQPHFAVIEEADDPTLGRKTVVPDGTIYFMPFANREEAHCICALLNSEMVCRFLSARSGKSKRGLPKKMVAQLALPKFDRHDERHLYLSRVSLQQHEARRHNQLAALDFEETVFDVFHKN